MKGALLFFATGIAFYGGGTVLLHILAVGW